MQLVVWQPICTYMIELANVRVFDIRGRCSKT